MHGSCCVSTASIMYTVAYGSIPFYRYITISKQRTRPASTAMKAARPMMSTRGIAWVAYHLPAQIENKLSGYHGLPRFRRNLTKFHKP